MGSTRRWRKRTAIPVTTVILHHNPVDTHECRTHFLHPTTTQSLNFAAITKHPHDVSITAHNLFILEKGVDILENKSWKLQAQAPRRQHPVNCLIMALCKRQILDYRVHFMDYKWITNLNKRPFSCLQTTIILNQVRWYARKQLGAAIFLCLWAQGGPWAQVEAIHVPQFPLASETWHILPNKSARLQGRVPQK